jgi:hypothetical protein
MREGAHHGGGRFIQSNRASLANVTAKRPALGYCQALAWHIETLFFQSFLRPHLATRSKTRGDNLHHSGEANRIINRAVACWVLFADPIVKLRGRGGSPTRGQGDLETADLGAHEIGDGAPQKTSLCVRLRAKRYWALARHAFKGAQAIWGLALKPGA